MKITDHEVPDAGKETLLFCLSVHGNERGGLEGGLRTAEDLAIAARRTAARSPTASTTTSSATGRKEPSSTSVEVARRAASAKAASTSSTSTSTAGRRATTSPHPPLAVRRAATRWAPTSTARCRRSAASTRRATRWRRARCATARASCTRSRRAGRGGLMAYGADIHGELTSQAYIDIMYPAGRVRLGQAPPADGDRRAHEVGHRRDALRRHHERDRERDRRQRRRRAPPQNTIPTKPAHWATVWDTLGYTDTGFIGDYLATDLGVTGMDYEIVLNHTVPDKAWNVYLQENHINASRAIIKTAMAYALFQDDEFNDANVRVDPRGPRRLRLQPRHRDRHRRERPGHPARARAATASAQDGQPVDQRPYSVSNRSGSPTRTASCRGRSPCCLRRHRRRTPAALDAVDTLVLADRALPPDARGRAGRRGGVLREHRAPGSRAAATSCSPTVRCTRWSTSGVVRGRHDQGHPRLPAFANFTDLTHPMAKGLRANARQLVEAAVLGYGIGDSASPMTASPSTRQAGQGGRRTTSVGTDRATNRVSRRRARRSARARSGSSAARCRRRPRSNDHRYGLRNYAMTYSGLFLMENTIQHDRPEPRQRRAAARNAG